MNIENASIRTQMIITGIKRVLMIDEPGLDLPAPGNDGLLPEPLSELDSESESVLPLKFGIFSGSNPSGIVMPDPLSLSLSLPVGGVKFSKSEGIPDGIPDGAEGAAI